MQPIITLCGSTSFKVEFLKAAQQLGEDGWLVISLTTFTHADEIPITAETKALLDVVHLQKITVSNAIYVINNSGYIGESTLREVVFAAVLRRKIFFMEQPTVALRNTLAKSAAIWSVGLPSAQSMF